MKNFLQCLVLLYLAFSNVSCTDDKTTSRKENLVGILSAILPYEMKEISKFVNDSSLTYSFNPDSNIIYLIPGYSYSDNGFELSFVGTLKDSYRELEISKNQYKQLSDSICKTKFIPFNIPKSNKEFEDNVRNGKVLAILLLYKVWIDQNGSHFIYFRSASFKDENFLEGYDSIRFFKKEKGKWVFEKEL